MRCSLTVEVGENNIADLRFRPGSKVAEASRVQVSSDENRRHDVIERLRIPRSGATPIFFFCAYLFHVINSRESIKKNNKHRPPSQCISFDLKFILYFRVRARAK